MQSIKKQKNRAYLASEQYTKQVLKNQYPMLRNDLNSSIINLKQSLLLWNRKIQEIKQPNN